MNPFVRTLLAGLAACTPISPADAADKKDADWPCVQRKVPTLSFGMMWAGSEPTGQSETDPALQQLAQNLAVRRTSLEEAAPLIETYAAKLVISSLAIFLMDMTS